MRKILIANRGEIARRVIRTAHAMGIDTVAVYSDADADMPHVREAGQAVAIGPAPAAESYLVIDTILAAAARTGADAIHPGYGFLSENARFAEACAAAGVTFIGPPAAAIRGMGLKDAAKRLMRQAKVPVVPGYQGEDQTLDRIQRMAEQIGYPILIKAVAGGGGKGMRRVDAPDQLTEALLGARREAQKSFGNDGVMLEKMITRARHVEVQVFADTHGNVIHLFERDCSAQRRHQKVLEEAPAPGLPDDMRQAMGEAAVRCAQAIGYVGAGTVEFIVDVAQGLTPESFYFMEMNTRLQVEHPVTEFVTGLDLVEWQIRVARGEPLPLRQDELRLRGHAIEARLYAEDPDNGFLPSIGLLDRLQFPAAAPGVRIDSGVEQGNAISLHYDPMIAKIIVHADERSTAIDHLLGALDATVVSGPKTNRAFLARLADHPRFRSGDVDTGLIEAHMGELGPPRDVPERIVALAALALTTPPEPIVSADPWTALGPWRMNLPARRHVDLVLPDGTAASISLTADNALVTVEGLGSPLRVKGQWRSDTRFDLDCEGELVRGTVLVRSHELEVRAWGRSFIMRRGDVADDRPEAAASDGAIIAPMPGKVLAVFVRDGESVAAGDRILLLEAMKMEHRLSAPLAGTVAALAVKEGDQVIEGTVLAEIRPD